MSETGPNYSEENYNGEKKRSSKVNVDISPDFLEFLMGTPDQRGGLIENYFRAQEAEVNRMVQELVSLQSSINTPLGRFNAGQAYMIKLAAVFKKLLDERLADYINYATVQFVSSTTAREAKETSKKRETSHGMAGVG